MDIGMSCVSRAQQHSTTYRAAVRHRRRFHGRGVGGVTGYRHPCVAAPGWGNNTAAYTLLPACSCESGQDAMPAPQPQQVFALHSRVVPEAIPPIRWSVHTMPPAIHVPTHPFRCPRAVRLHGPSAVRWSAFPVPFATSPPFLGHQDSGAITCNVPLAVRRPALPVPAAAQVPNLVRRQVCAVCEDGPVFHRRPSCPVPLPIRVAPLSADHPAAILVCEFRLLHP